jgi:hypothetical protein
LKDQNGESMDDEEVDENEQMDRSSEDRLSPPAVMDEEVVSDGDSNDNTNGTELLLATLTAKFGSVVSFFPF